MTRTNIHSGGVNNTKARIRIWQDPNEANLLCLPFPQREEVARDWESLKITGPKLSRYAVSEGWCAQWYRNMILSPCYIPVYYPSVIRFTSHGPMDLYTVWSQRGIEGLTFRIYILLIVYFLVVFGNLSPGMRLLVSARLVYNVEDLIVPKVAYSAWERYKQSQCFMTRGHTVPYKFVTIKHKMESLCGIFITM